MHDKLIQGLQRDIHLPFHYCPFKCFQKSVWNIWQTSWTVWILFCLQISDIHSNSHGYPTLQKFQLFKPHSPPPQKFHWTTVGELWIFFGILHIFRRILCLTFGSPWLFFYSNVEPLSKYSPVTLHLSPATRILNENLGYNMSWASTIEINIEIV